LRPSPRFRSLAARCAVCLQLRIHIRFVTALFLHQGPGCLQESVSSSPLLFYLLKNQDESIRQNKELARIRVEGAAAHVLGNQLGCKACRLQLGHEAQSHNSFRSEIFFNRTICLMLTGTAMPIRVVPLPNIKAAPSNPGGYNGLRNEEIMPSKSA